MKHNTAHVCSYKCFLSRFSFQALSTLPWISPLQLTKPTTPKPDPPTSCNTNEVQRKRKFISHDSAIELIKSTKDPQYALEVFNKVSKQKGFYHNNGTYATILDKLARCKKLHAIDAILQQMSYETCRFHEGIFLNLMKHFSRFSMHDRVLHMFQSIQPIVRKRPSPKAISTCLNLLIESDRVDLARNLLLQVKESASLKSNACIFNILIKYHCKAGNLDSAFDVFKEMTKVSSPNLITYSTLMEGLCRSGKLREAMDMFEEMVSERKISPDALTYNVLIDGFCRAGKVYRAMKIMNFMKDNGCSPNIYNYSALMNGYCKEGKVWEAKEVFKQMKSVGIKADTVGYTTLINCLCRVEQTDEAIALLGEMKEKGCKADTVTFNVILRGLCIKDRFEEALQMLNQLPYEGVHLDKGSYRIVLNLLSQKGELKRAIELLGLMLDRGFFPHHATSNELLVQFCKAGMADDAAKVLLEWVEVGLKPSTECWEILVEFICRERKLLYTFELLDDLVLLE